jgi:Bacterial regulatory proteins, luxR family
LLLYTDESRTTLWPPISIKSFNLSTKTIGTYRKRIKEKMGLKNAAGLIRFAVRWSGQNKQK